MNVGCFFTPLRARLDGEQSLLLFLHFVLFFFFYFVTDKVNTYKSGVISIVLETILDLCLYQIKGLFVYQD